MTKEEQNFWFELRVQIIDSERFRDMYCDWIEPKAYFTHTLETTIEGTIGFLTPEVIVLKFKLILRARSHPLSDIDWKNLIPKELGDHWIGQNGDTIELTL